MMWLAAAPAVVAAVYYLLAIVAAVTWGRRGRPSGAPPGPGGARREKATPEPTPVSILKPIHGRDPRLYEAILSHAAQKYPEFEILFGVSDPADPALPDLDRLRRAFPQRPIAIVVAPTDAPNAKAGVLAALARRAQCPLLLVNDSDIAVEAGYLLAVTAPLDSPETGLVTCLYRARAESWASRFEALGIATEFAPGVLVARLLGISEFALGATMVLRAETLRRIGGFEAIADYLADDYQLGRRIRQLGLRIEFAPVVVETNLGAESWLHTWRRQVRWSRTIRVTRPTGYYGYVVTHGTLWALVGLAARQWRAAALAISLRILAGVVVGAVILKDRSVLRDSWMMPLRDLFGFAVWLAGLFGNSVRWRDRELRLRPDGRIFEGRIFDDCDPPPR